MGEYNTDLQFWKASTSAFKKRVILPPEAILVNPLPINLGLTLGAPIVTAENAGPVWQGGGYWSADGIGYWSLPAFDAIGEWELVVRVTRSAGSSVYASGMRKDANNFTIGGFFAAPVSRNYIFVTGGGLSYASATPDVQGNRTMFIGAEASASQFKANVRIDDADVVVAADAVNAIGAGAVFVLGAYRDNNNAVVLSTSGVRFWDATLYQRKLTTTERTNIRAGGVQIDPLTIVSDSVWDSWDWAQWNGTVVPGRVNGHNATPINMAPNITTGAIF